ncbi:hypothetical protein BC826DRAFT_1005164 [Russula brevipes]|nr:hypothetical protein BC826DRAFT_1005164 [Russula brevipes]
MGLFTILVSTLASVTFATASFQLFLEDGSLPVGVTNSSACGKALQTSIACDSSLQQASQTYFDANHSTVVCTSDCFTSLASYRARVATACSDATIQGEDIVYPSTVVADMLLFSYNATCLKDGATGAWCGPQFSTWANESTADSGLSGQPTSQLCSSCFLQHAELVLQSPIGYDPNAVDDFSVLQQTCGISYNLTTPGTAYINVTTTPPASTVCLSGKTYTVQPGDTCASISRSQNVGTKDLISLNGLDSSCITIQGGQSLCLPASCQTYLVQSGDTCISILSGLTGVSFAQFYSWNPTINPYCTNLIAGTYICVSPPGGAYTYTIPSVTVTPKGSAITTTAPPPTSTAEGTVPNCGKWYVVQLGDDCNRVLLNQTITLSDFISANPEINANCTNLFQGYAYCVYQIPRPAYPSTYAPVPTNLAPGTTKSCFTYYTIQSGDNCQAITSNWTITVPEFKQWNPELNSDCSNLIAGEAYCVYAERESSFYCAMSYC